VCSRGPARIDALPFVINGETRFLGLTLKWIGAGEAGTDELLIIGSDVTEARVAGQQLRQAQKLEAIGQLAAGIAHEINTPIQYLGDNTRFPTGVLGDVSIPIHHRPAIRMEAPSGTISPQTLERLDVLAEEADFDYMQEEIPHAIEQSLEGIQRVTRIVLAMKEFFPSRFGTEKIDRHQPCNRDHHYGRPQRVKYVCDVKHILIRKCLWCSATPANSTR